MPNYRHKKSTEQQIVESILRGIVAIIKLPFRGLFKSSSKGASIDRAEIYSRWREIEKLSVGNDQHELAQAIIMADKLFDAVLQVKGLAGQVMADRLKSAKDLYSDYSVYQGAWDAHKLRNQIVHEVNHVVGIAEGQQAVEKFKKAIFSII